MPRYADILLPLAQPLYTFAVGEGMHPVEGDAVAVQFGARSVYTGIVWRLHDDAPESGRTKPILRVLHERPLVTRGQMRFWEWMADYYMCTVGEVMRVALPSTVKPHARSEEEFAAYSPRCEKVLTLDETMLDDETAERMRRRAPKRYALVQALRSAGGTMLRRETDADAPTIRALENSYIIKVSEREVAPEALTDCAVLPELSPAQSRAFEEVCEGFASRGVVLLHGVTSSGKTEIYMHLIARALARGEDVLYLVPEISVTTQLVERLRKAFGERVVPYHSKLTPARRTAAYMRLLNSSGGNLVVGARSSVFMPFRRLGLAIVDEEHDSGYKQSEPSPRYNGRDAAVMLASIHGAKAVLGSATPSMESYANALAGKYVRVRLDERYGGSVPPRVMISDTMLAVKRGERKSRFNKILLDKIDERLSRGEQVMLFQNRLGYSPYVECPECDWTARCPHCNVTLTLHRSSGELRCHYCGWSMPTPRRCPSCAKADVAPMGFGTERVEDEISAIFPHARVLRLDGETAVSDAAYRRIISAFARREADILVGTQIISKGLDFDGVTLIGILNADNLLNAPDFRASERAWQLLVQVAGRCGRRDAAGEVVVQTAEPTHPLFAWIDERCYEPMAAAMLDERRLFSYPPYTRLIRITMRSSMAERLAVAARSLDAALRRRFGSRVFGPAAPMIDRVRDEHILEIMLKIEVSASFARARALLREEIAAVRGRSDCRGVTIICDVDVQ